MDPPCELSRDPITAYALLKPRVMQNSAARR